MEHFSESDGEEDDEAQVEIKPGGAEFTAAKKHHKPKHSKREEEEDGDDIPMVKPELDITCMLALLSMTIAVFLTWLNCCLYS